MTKLNPDQTLLLDNIVITKDIVDREIARLRKEFDADVDSARATVRVAVGKAVAARVPDRRIGMALGTSDHKTIKSYYPEVDDGSTD